MRAAAIRPRQGPRTVATGGAAGTSRSDGRRGTRGMNPAGRPPRRGGGSTTKWCGVRAGGRSSAPPGRVHLPPDVPRVPRRPSLRDDCAAPPVATDRGPAGAGPPLAGVGPALAVSTCVIAFRCRPGAGRHTSSVCSPRVTRSEDMVAEATTPWLPDVFGARCHGCPTPWVPAREPNRTRISAAFRPLAPPQASAATVITLTPLPGSSTVRGWPVPPWPRRRRARPGRVACPPSGSAASPQE